MLTLQLIAGPPAPSLLPAPLGLAALIPEGTTAYDAFVWATAAASAAMVLCTLFLIRPPLRVSVIIILGAADFVSDWVYLMVSVFVHPAIFWSAAVFFMVAGVHYAWTRALPALRHALGVSLSIVLYTPEFAQWQEWTIEDIKIADLTLAVSFVVMKAIWLVVFTVHKVAMFALFSFYLAYYLTMVSIGLFLYLVRLTTLASVDQLLCKALSLGRWPLSAEKVSAENVFGPSEESKIAKNANASLQLIFFVELVLEDIPQFVLQVTNNELGAGWSTFEIVTTALSVYMLVIVGSRFLYHMGVMGQSMREVPVGGTARFESVLPCFTSSVHGNSHQQ